MKGGKRLRARRDREVYEVDIDRQPRQIADEQVDCGAALEREDVLACDLGDDADQQGDLRRIDVGRHQLSSGSSFCFPDFGTVIRNSGSSSPPFTIWRLPEPMSISSARSWRVQAWRYWPEKSRNRRFAFPQRHAISRACASFGLSVVRPSNSSAPFSKPTGQGISSSAIGRAPVRERVCQDVEISGAAV